MLSQCFKSSFTPLSICFISNHDPGFPGDAFYVVRLCCRLHIIRRRDECCTISIHFFLLSTLRALLQSHFLIALYVFPECLQLLNWVSYGQIQLKCKPSGTFNMSQEIPSKAFVFPSILD